MVPLQKILVMSSGSRGDIQPYVAMACVLKEAGYHVECATCHNHAKLVTECGLPFHGCFADSEKAVREQDALKKSMAEGDAMAFIRGLNEVVREGAEPTLLHWLGIVEKLKPDLILVGSLTDYYGALARYKLGIPTLDVKLQCLSTRPQRMIFGLPNLPCGLNSWVVRNVLIAGVYKGWQKDLDPWALKHLGCRLCDSYTWELFLADCDKPTVSPVVVCQASRFGDVLYPERPAGVVLIGQCVIDREAQERLARGNGADNFGDEDTLAKIEVFIARGDRPVYMGWGSMICKSPEYMAELAVRALMRSGLRAIIQGGWAHLSMETLARATSNEALLQYAAGNMLFVEKAPHEWLFPRCACTVHHGGAGTIAAAVRAACQLLSPRCSWTSMTTPTSSTSWASALASRASSRRSGRTTWATRSGASWAAPRWPPGPRVWARRSAQRMALQRWWTWFRSSGPTTWRPEG